MIPSRLRRPLYWAAGLAAAVLVGALVLAPAFLDLPAVRQAVERKVSDAVRGQVTWEDLGIRLLPLPHGVLRGARVAIPGMLTVSVERVELDLKLLPLLRGRAEIRAVTVLQPVVAIRIPVSSARTAVPRTDRLSAYRRAVRMAADSLQRFAPEMILSLEQGRVEIRAPALPPIDASEVNLRIRTDATGMAVEAAAAGNYWDRAELEGRVEFADLRLGGMGGRASLELDKLYSWLRSQEKLAKTLQAAPGVSGRVDVTLNGLQGTLDRPDALAYDVTVQPRQVRVIATDLPGAVTVNGGSLRIMPSALDLDRIGISLLDSTARLSGRLPEYRRGSGRIDASVSEGTAGKELVDWIWRRAGLPDRLQLTPPLRFAARRLRWSDAGLDLAASVRFEAGPEVGIELGLRRRALDGLDIRSLTIKDRGSDAVLSFAPRGRLIDVSFSGVLTSQSIASMLAHAQGERPGQVSGDLRITLDRDHQARSSARGRLAAEHLDLRELLPVPVRVERADLQADGTTLHVHELAIDWAEQKATIRGDFDRRPGVWVVKADVDSPGIVLDAFLPAEDNTGGEAAAERKKGPEAPKLWPLPVTGTIAVRAEHLKFRQFRIEPVRATLALEPQRAELKVDEAALCGIAFPFSVRAVPGNADTAMHLSAKGQQLENVARCFSDQQLLITGEFDLNARLTARGHMGEIVSTLAGPVELRARRGEIRKFALLGNILALTNVKELLTEGARLDKGGFPYRDIKVKGNFGGGSFSIEEGSLDSPALGLAATGTIGLADYRSSLTVLLAPFSRIDRLARSVPIVGYVMGGLFTSIPVGVSGDIRDPLVVPLGPGAVTSELLGIFERTLKLPAKLIEPAGTARPAD